MKRDPLLSLLSDYEPIPGAEQEMFLEINEFVRRNPECFERSLVIGHITASGWVVSPDRSHVLLMHHRKLDKWFQPGGHCDGDPDVLAVAYKEVIEETGLDDVTLIAAAIFDVDVHRIPASSKEAAHLHYDIRFLFEADPAQTLVINSESKDLKWVPVNKISMLNDSESVMRMAEKTGKILIF